MNPPIPVLFPYYKEYKTHKLQNKQMDWYSYAHVIYTSYIHLKAVLVCCMRDRSFAVNEVHILNVGSLRYLTCYELGYSVIDLYDLSSLRWNDTMLVNTLQISELAPYIVLL